jgi:GntR family transcriptional regulator
MGMPIDRDAAMPLYQQLAADIRGRIERGELSGRVPSITTLMGETGLADKTVRAALHQLAADGLTETIPGRGTFVRKPAG